MAEDGRQYIARISYGKDSLKMLDVIITRGLPLDRVTTTDVWATDTVRAELPSVLEAKERIEEKLWQMYRINVEHLCARNPDGSKRTYEQMFYHIPVRRSKSVQVERERRATARINPRLSGPLEPVVSGWTQTECQNTACREQLPDSHQTQDTIGARNSKFRGGGDKRLSPEYRSNLVPEAEGKTERKQGFPATISPWCRKLKIDKVKTPFPDAPATRGRKRNIVEYIGIAADEPDRFGQLNDRKRAPLVEFGIEEDLCGLFCQYNDMLLPSYETSCRDGCWFCHNQGVDSLRNLWKNHPDLWALLMKWDLDSPVTFKADGHTVHDFDKRFRWEQEGWIDTHMPFRWAMLEKKPKFRATNFEEISLFDRR